MASSDWVTCGTPTCLDGSHVATRNKFFSFKTCMEDLVFFSIKGKDMISYLSRREKDTTFSTFEEKMFSFSSRMFFFKIGLRKRSKSQKVYFKKK